MIRLRDATTLALTKLRTRKIRLIVTVVVSGLLFTGLATASMVARGTFESIDSFSQEGFGSRYIVSGTSMPSFGYMENQDIIMRAKQIHEELVTRKTAEAKRLRLTYDPKSDLGPLQSFDTPDGTHQTLDTTHPAAVQAIQEYKATQKGPDLEAMKAQASAYGAERFYQTDQLPFMTDGSVIKVLKDGEESFDQKEMPNGPPRGLDSFSMMWQSASAELLEPFMLPGQSLVRTDDNKVPIIVPVTAAEELLGLQSLPASANADDRLARLKELREKAGALSFEICVRNRTSQELVGQAIAVKQEVEARKDDRDYRQPPLVYGLPTESCGEVPIVRDVRTAAEKQQAERQEEFDRIFGKQPPTQEKIVFRVVGVTPDIYEGAASRVGEIIKSLVTSSLGSGWFSPKEYIDERPVLKTLFDGTSDVYSFPPAYYAEFAAAEDAVRFMDEGSCNPDFSVVMEGGKDPYQQCADDGKPFTLSSYGSNSLALDSARRGFGRIFRYATLAVALIAAVIMMGTVGRMIADSRRETAVFRAIGAKKLDISLIYIIYTFMLALLISAFAVIVGAAIAQFVHTKYSPAATVEALVAYNASDLTRSFRLYSFYWPEMLQLIGLALVGGVISAVLPLIRNLRRNPIRDMRDDT